jgi:hypothetical protein
MSLFGLADIKFNKQDTPKGPLRALEGSEFQNSTLRYPSDIGGYDKGHYMVFFIREQKDTAFASAAGPASSNDVINALSQGDTIQNTPLVNNSVSNFGSGLLNKLNSGLSSLNSATGGALSGITGSISSGASGLLGSVNNVFGQKPTIVSGDGAKTQQTIGGSIRAISNQSFINTTRLTKEAIALYMPDTLAYTYSQSYDTASMGGEIAGQALAAGGAVLEKFKQEGALAAGGAAFKSVGMAATKKVFDTGGALTGSSQTAEVAFQALLGAATNPLLEMIYKSPNFRTFQFDFTFYPRDEKEAFEVQKIIDSFRFHQAPEFVPGTKGFLRPPSEFDIRFYYGGYQNPNIPQIATCVLTSIDVNYAPNGWSAYEVPGNSKPELGGTGMPVAIQMNLQFTEKTYLTKQDFREKSKENPGLPGRAAPLNSAGESGQTGDGTGMQTRS